MLALMASLTIERKFRESVRCSVIRKSYLHNAPVIVMGTVEEEEHFFFNYTFSRIVFNPLIAVFLGGTILHSPTIQAFPAHVDLFSDLKI